MLGLTIKPWVGAVLMMGLFFAQTVGADPVEKPVALTFGLYQSDNARVMYRKFSPVLKALQAKASARLGRTVAIDLMIFKTYREANDALVAGKVDFARFGPASYVIAKEREPGVRLLAMEERKGRKRFNGVIVVRKESPFEALTDLKGGRFAFGDARSTIGRYLAQGELAAAGVQGKDLGGYAYLGRHDKVFQAVLLGDFDAGAIKETTFNRFNREGKLRVLTRFENVTKPWIARAGLPDEAANALSAALWEIREPTLLKELKVTGFLPSRDAEYAMVREGIRHARRFGDEPAR